MSLRIINLSHTEDTNNRSLAHEHDLHGDFVYIEQTLDVHSAVRCYVTQHSAL